MIHDPIRKRPFSWAFVAASGCGLAAASGCSGTQGPRPVAVISHVVFVEFDDPTQTQAALNDADAMLAGIPGVVSYSAGPHIDTGRASILNDYDLGIVIGFDTTEDYAAYVVHPDHVAFVEKWKPGIKALRVYDIHDPD